MRIRGRLPNAGSLVMYGDNVRYCMLLVVIHFVQCVSLLSCRALRLRRLEANLREVLSTECVFGLLNIDFLDLDNLVTVLYIHVYML